MCKRVCKSRLQVEIKYVDVSEVPCRIPLYFLSDECETINRRSKDHGRERDLYRVHRMLPEEPVLGEPDQWQATRNRYIDS